MTSAKIAKGLLLGLAGAVLGAGVATWWMTESFRAGNEYAILNWAAAEGEAAMEQYLLSRPEVAAYALERYVAFLRGQRDKGLRTLDEKVVNMDLGLALGRLGLTEERLGRTNQARETYEEALRAFAQAGKSVESTEKLKHMIGQLDQRVKRTWKRQSQS